MRLYVCDECGAPMPGTGGGVLHILGRERDRTYDVCSDECREAITSRGGWCCGAVVAGIARQHFEGCDRQQANEVGDERARALLGVADGVGQEAD